MKREALLVGLLVIVMLSSFASAEILVGQPATLYNVGDKFDLSVVLSPNADSSGFFTADLICGSGEVELYKNPVSVKAGEQKEVIVSTTLDKTFIGDLIGECSIKAAYVGETGESQTFEISNDIDVSLEINGISFDPGKDMIVSGKATKANGDPLNGYVEASIDELNLSVSRMVSNGEFSFNFTVQDNSMAGAYALKASAYEKDSDGNIINEGNTSLNVRVRQVPEKESIAVNKESITAGEDLVYTVVLNDQAGQQVTDDVALVISSPDGSPFLKQVVKAGTSNTLTTSYNYTPGYWKIEATSNGIDTKKIFYMEELEKASFSVVNGTLVVTNLGNVPYNKPVQVTINGKNELIDNLKVGVDASTRVKLSVSSDGEYDVSVNDGTGNVELGKAALTGNSVAFDQVFNGKYSVAFWVLIIAILGVVIFYFYRKTKDKMFVGRAPSSESKVSAPIRLLSADKSKKSIVESGQRGEALVVALKINNLDSMEKSDSNAPGTISGIVEKAKSAGGRVYSDGNYKTIILSQMTTKEADNNLRAVKLASDIASALNEHNKKYAHKIDFGIGVNNGEMIGEIKDGTLKFTPVGNTLIAAKRIAEKAKEEVLLSGGVHRRVIGSVKCDKVQGAEYWKVGSIINRDKHSGFIEGFMKRQEGKDFWGSKK